MRSPSNAVRLANAETDQALARIQIERAEAEAIAQVRLAEAEVQRIKQEGNADVLRLRVEKVRAIEARETKAVTLDDDEVGSLVLGRRRELGLRQPEAAAMAGMRAKRLSEIENGYPPPPSDRELSGLARALNLEYVPGFLARKAPPPSTSLVLPSSAGSVFAPDANLTIE